MTAYAGPGKYDDLATIVRERAQARGVLVIVIEGNKGEGFSFQGDLLVFESIPDLLENVANSIRRAKQQAGSG